MSLSLPASSRMCNNVTYFFQTNTVLTLCGCKYLCLLPEKYRWDEVVLVYTAKQILLSLSVEEDLFSRRIATNQLEISLTLDWRSHMNNTSDYRSCAQLICDASGPWPLVSVMFLLFIYLALFPAKSGNVAVRNRLLFSLFPVVLLFIAHYRFFFLINRG